MEEQKSVFRIFKDEINDYFTKVVQVGENPSYSEAKLKRRISLFANKIYPNGKFDSQGSYKFWFDIVQPRIDADVKNIDFDTKNIEVYTDRKQDVLPNIIVNLKNREYLRDTGQDEEINSAIEEGEGWGNVVWKKIKGGYERVDLRNFYVINQTAFNLDESPVIERHEMSQSDLRKKSGIWKNIDDTIKGCKQNTYKATPEVQGNEMTMPHYPVYERNGEVSYFDLKQAKGESPIEIDRDKFTLAKIITSGIETQGEHSFSPKYVLYAEEIKKMPYKEYHRGIYKGKWWREGIYELLFDCQVRANQIGNQIAQALEYASKLILASEDKLIVQNILSDMKNGDIIVTKGLKQVELRSQAIDQLIADWNKNIQIANDLANTREIVQGEAQPGQPFRLGALLNINANKLFTFLRQKLAIPFREMFEEWIIPDLINELKVKEIIRLTGDADVLERIYKIVVDDWYISNLLAFGPHDEVMRELLKAQKLEELKNQEQLLMKALKEYWKEYKPNVNVIITGENINLDSDLQTLSSFAQLEADPVRRSAILELMARKKGLDFASLPKTPPIMPTVAPPQATQKPLALAGEQGT